MRYDGTGVPGVFRDDTGPGGYGSIHDPNAPDLPPRPRDHLVRQAAQRANALRRMQMDFLLPGNRAAGVGGVFNPGKGMGFQVAANNALLTQANAGKQLSDINPKPLTYDQVVNQGMIPPDLKTLPRNPFFQGTSGAKVGTGFMIPANQPKVLTTGGGLPPVKK